jgi:hypothetical protein
MGYSLIISHLSPLENGPGVPTMGRRGAAVRF